MDILLILFIIIALLSAISIFSIIYKEGKLLNNKFILALLAFLITLVTFITFTALPSNYIFKKSLTFALGTIGIVGCILYLTNIKNSLVARVMIGVSIIGNCLLLIF